MKDKLIDIMELLEMLGYEDQRSVKQWCVENKIPLFRIGKRTYTISNFVDLYITHELKLFTAANYANPDEVMSAVINNDADEFKRAVHLQIRVGQDKREKGNKGRRSKAAQTFLKNIE